MTKQEILDELYRSDKVKQLLARLPENYRDDLQQEVFILLLLKPDVEILDIWRRGKIYSLYSKLIYNQLFWNRSCFHKLYNTYQLKEVKGLPPEYLEPAEYLEFDINSEVEDAMNCLSQYHNKLLRMYAEIGTYRDTGDKLGIAWKSVYNGVQKAKKQVKTKLNKTL